LRTMAPDNAIVCKDRTTREMCADIRQAADTIEALRAEVKEIARICEEVRGVDKRQLAQAEAEVAKLTKELNAIPNRPN